MSAAAIATAAGGRLGIMVRTAREVFIYRDGTADAARSLRLVDLSGLPTADWREVSVGYVGGLDPGHLYAVDLLDAAGRVVGSAGPVQTPWLPCSDPAPGPFPAPYHRS